MSEKNKNEMAAFRYGIISPVIYSARKDQKNYFKEMAKKTYNVPHLGSRKYKWTTFKHWLKVYRKSGIEGLTPRGRNDRGESRRIDPDLEKQIISVQQENSFLSCSNLYRLLIERNHLPYPHICEATLRTFLKTKDLYTREKAPSPRKKYEVPFVNDLWVSDFMHGPRNLFGKKNKTYLCAIIDDHSRMIVGAQFFIQENSITLEEVFKKAILVYGLPNKFYADNGAPFSSNHLLLACARLVIALIHSKPYDSPSRGKIERFFRSVREMFLNPLAIHEINSLDQLNELFTQWLDKGYHKKYHKGIDQRPIDRYLNGIEKVKIRSISDKQLDLNFYQTIKRKVKKDSTISVNGTLYETPPKYISTTVEVRFPSSKPNDLTIYEENKPVHSIKKVDIHKNAQTPLGMQFSKLKKEGELT